MKPTERSSLRSCSACASGSVIVNMMSGSPAAVSSAAALPSSSTRSATRRSCCLPFATTKSTRVVMASRPTRGLAQACEEIVLVLAVAARHVDERAGERELLPREHPPDHVVGQAHPEAGRIDLRAVREQCLAPLVQVVADVDQ